MPKKNRWNELVRQLPGGDDVLENLEAWHGRVAHLKKEGKPAEAVIAQEALNDIAVIADAMRDDLKTKYKRENGQWMPI